MLEAEHVTAGYGDLVALRDVSLEVNEGEIVAIVGANGSGKTTLMKAISGLTKPLSGDILWQGKSISRLNPSEIVQAGIAHVPEGRKLFSSMTVEENLTMGAYVPRSRPALKSSMEWVCSLFPVLKERRLQLAGTLSGGEQQMLAVGRGLMSQPTLLLLDEPSLGLAPLIARDILQIVQTIQASGTSVLLVEQNVAQALAIASSGYVLENGSVVLHGTGKELLDDKHVGEAYLGLGTTH